jgi:predicted O-methyltransferase YrrM
LVLGEFDSRRARILELGSFEGMSACFFLRRLPDATITCVDTFAGDSRLRAVRHWSANLEERFDNNVALVGASRVGKLRGATTALSATFLMQTERFDPAYVDASHRALDVLADAALSWQLIALGGICIFDDYGGIPLGVEPLDHPTRAP